MNVYFFSRHEAQEQMIADVGGKIDAQYKGTISAIKKLGEIVEFLESFDNQEPVKRSIPIDSIVIAVAPLPLQESWLKAGITALLAPQNRRDVDEAGVVTFNYNGLLHIKKIEVISEQWSGSAVSLEQKAKERALLS